MKPITCLFALLFLSINTFSQSKFSEIEKLLDVAVYVRENKIVTEKIDGKEYEVWYHSSNKNIPKTVSFTGTCFPVLTEFDIYLVTADHVARFTSLNSAIAISSPNDTPLVYRLGDIIKHKSKLDWTFHKHADVAVIQLDETKLSKEFFQCSLPFSFLNIDLEAPFRERKVTTYGYPLDLGIGKKISPITKTSNPSSGLIELPRFDNKKTSTFFLLDDPSVGGFSGGPVFELPQVIGYGENATTVTVYRLVGLVHGTRNDKNGGGFAAIVPSVYIKETIELAPGFSDTVMYKYPNGNNWSERVYKNGCPWTVISNFDANGSEQEKGSLLKGNGTLYIYDENSKLIEIRTYKNGSLVIVEKKK